ncbi:hypothetical protein L1085_034100 [Streptomyces sp. MSC1_001]|jgi:hypothetical protein|uniref:hypothetical protein n=1 Tax=Streptomyces sp. MSC1_001 TaxID=2909263 RepID=UPI0020307931|nr:hypothetical protein [Streptomyces sp. MSC1_001]
MVGFLIVLLIGVGLMTAGAVWKGRSVRPFAASRARSVARREYARDLQRAADLVIATARRSGEGEPAIVTVEAVVLTTRERYGYAVVERRDAAAALRRRFEHRRCAVDCVTDAYG